MRKLFLCFVGVLFVLTIAIIFWVKFSKYECNKFYVGDGGETTCSLLDFKPLITGENESDRAVLVGKLLGYVCIKGCNLYLSTNISGVPSLVSVKLAPNMNGKYMIAKTDEGNLLKQKLEGRQMVDLKQIKSKLKELKGREIVTYIVYSDVIDENGKLLLKANHNKKFVEAYRKGNTSYVLRFLYVELLSRKNIPTSLNILY